MDRIELSIKLAEANKPHLTRTSETEKLRKVWRDKFGVFYSTDRKHLVYVPENIKEYNIICVFRRYPFTNSGDIRSL